MSCSGAGDDRPALWPRRNVEATLHRRPRQPPLEPAADILEVIEGNDLARTVEADQIAYPTQHRDVGDAVLVVQEPLPAAEMGVHHPEQALRLAQIALQRPLVLIFAPGEFVEEADLAEHRPDPAHLEMHPLDRLPAPRRILWQKLSGLLCEILQDRARLEQRQRLSAGAVGIED